LRRDILIYINNQLKEVQKMYQHPISAPEITKINPLQPRLPRLRLSVTHADPLTLQNIADLLGQVQILGDPLSPTFDGSPWAVSNLKYWLQFCEWGVVDAYSDFSGPVQGTNQVTFNDLQAAIAKGALAACEASKMRGERNDYHDAKQTRTYSSNIIR
jgi:hypothetical protein